MTKHAVAMVRWDVFRPGRGAGYGAAAFDYGCDQPRLLERVADGGTLWLVTSRRRGTEPRRYHLAYKLVRCSSIDPAESMFSHRWKYVVRAGDWQESRHFGYNDALATLRRLHFTTGRPMREMSNVGLRLLGIPQLTSDDIAVLERLQHQIEHGRTVFVSYAHDDVARATTIEAELGARDISVSRDVAFLRPGQDWAEALQREVEATGCFVVLVSARSAARDWVRREVAWALHQYEQGELVTAVIPVVLDEQGWNAFPELHRFERWEYPAAGDNAAAFDRLAGAITRRRT